MKSNGEKIATVLRCVLLKRRKTISYREKNKKQPYICDAVCKSHIYQHFIFVIKITKQPLLIKK